MRSGCCACLLALQKPGDRSRFVTFMRPSLTLKGLVSHQMRPLSSLPSDLGITSVLGLYSLHAAI